MLFNKQKISFQSLVGVQGLVKILVKTRQDSHSEQGVCKLRANKYKHLLRVENFKGSQFSRSKSKSLVSKRGRVLKTR